MRTWQTALEAKVTKLEEQIRKSMASSLDGSPPPTPVMLTAWPIVKHQLEHDQQLDEHGPQVEAPEAKEHTTYVQYTTKGLESWLSSLGKSLGNILWIGFCTYGIMGLIL
jgi:hypothetical protein